MTLLTLLLLPPALGAVPPDSRDFFEKRVRPVLVNRCFKCHGPESKGRGGLRLDSRASLLKGGERGPALDLAQPENSLLLRALRHDDVVQMPPRAKLPAREIADLTTWVKQGAPWPGSQGVVESSTPANKTFTAEQKSFWAFQPPQASPLPAVNDPSWVQSPVDAFILAGLEARGLAPAPRASKRTLLRRVTFDLTGLPPTPEEVQAFLDDHSPDAYARVVERLLASLAYGERWGRHWLDVARYADSNGMDENLVQANAWRYRDYVVRVFNQDKPYDAFVREQLAGDLLPATDEVTRGERIIATGFLSLGPKMLAEDDPVKMEMDIVDEQLDTTGRAFLGLTLGCARCHDHKFDPITIEDYYALAGIFKSTQTMDNFKVVARWHERPIATREAEAQLQEYQTRIDSLTRQIDNLHQKTRQQLLDQARRQVPRYLSAARQARQHARVLANLKPLMAGPAEARPQGVMLFEAESYQRGNVKKENTGYGEGIGVIYNQGTLPNIAEYDLLSREAGNYRLEIRHAAAQARPVGVLLDGQVIRTDAAGHVTGGWYPQHQQWAVEAILTLQPGKHTLRLERAGPFPHFDKLALVPHRLAPLSPRGRGVGGEGEEIAIIPRTPEQLAAQQDLNPVFLRQWIHYLDRVGKIPTGSDLERAVQDPAGPFALSEDLSLSYPKPIVGQIARLEQQRATLEKARPQLPQAMAVGEGKIADLHVHLRGSYLTLGAVVPRRFPRIFADTRQANITRRQSGRLELARWITHPSHPLTARVMVNRIWHWHFGNGLVRTPDNFGLLGDRPVNQPLLDWLALRFMDRGWSIKAMHRLILLSSTYQMSTRHDPRAAQLDPDNRLHWRWQRRRLDAEEIRDGLLAVSGQLERTMGGSLMQGKNRAYVPGYPNTSYDHYDSLRRSVYLPVIRSDLYKVFQAFDFADPSTSSGKRATTTVAPQALFLMNGKLVLEQTRHLAEALLQQSNLDATRVREIYLRAYGRPPTPQETARALTFLARAEKILAREENQPPDETKLRAWQSLCRVLLAGNEFLYVE